MVGLSEIHASNARIASALPPGLVAVFVGGTSGVGEYTLKALAQHAVKPRIYFVGRSQEAADRIVSECTKLNPGGRYEFIRSDVSVLSNVDDVCHRIKRKEKMINILFETQATMGFSKTTSEGLPLATALVMHSRTRFILNLLPLLQNAPALRRVVSVGAATLEGPIDLDNIPATGFPLFKMRDQVASVTTILLEEAARRAPDVSFVNTCPGVVRSGILRDAEGWRIAITIAISKALMYFIETKPEEAAARHLFYATSAMFPPGRGGDTFAGVALDRELWVCRGTNGQKGSGVYSVDPKSECASPKVEELLARFRKDGTADRVWEYVAADFKKITGSEVAL